MFRTKVVEKNQNTHFSLSNFFRKLFRLSDNVEKYGTVGQVTDDNKKHAHFMPDT